MANSAPGLSIATALFFIWSTLTFAVRAWVKFRRSENRDWDDYTIFAALVVALLHVIAVFKAINTENGQSIHDLSNHDQSIVQKALYASELFYVCSVGFTKISTGFFVARFTRHGRQMHIAYTLTALCGVWTAVSILIIGLRGQLQQPWTTLNGSETLFTRWIGVESSGLFMEFALWGLCINIIWTLSMPKLKRVFILTIFGCRLLLVPIVTMRLIWLSPSRNTDLVATDTTANILTEAAMNFAIMSSCVTCLKPFLQPFHSEYVVSTVDSGSNAYPGNSLNKSREAYYRLSAISDSGRKQEPPKILVKNVGADEATKQSLATYSTTSAQTLRPDRFEQHVVVSASPRSSLVHNDSDTGEMIIRKTEEWSVRFEEERRPDAKPLQVGLAV